jgi:hypothetical protein
MNWVYSHEEQTLCLDSVGRSKRDTPLRIASRDVKWAVLKGLLFRGALNIPLFCCEEN